jgi:two-component system, LytTR family, response regulator
MADERRPMMHAGARGGELEKLRIERVLVRSGGRAVFVRVAEIDWIEAQGNYLRLHRGGDSYLMRQTMGEMEAGLDPRKFVRIHRSTIVNIERVKHSGPMPHGDYAVQLHNGRVLPLSRSYRHKIPTSLRSTP